MLSMPDWMNGFELDELVSISGSELFYFRWVAVCIGFGAFFQKGRVSWGILFPLRMDVVG